MPRTVQYDDEQERAVNAISEALLNLPEYRPHTKIVSGKANRLKTADRIVLAIGIDEAKRVLRGMEGMEGSAPDEVGTSASWLRCYRCWSQNLEIQMHYDAIRRIDPETGIPAEGIDEVQEAAVQCLDCMHDQPHLTFQDDRVVPIEDRWERMVAGTPWVASCTVTVDQERVESCAGPEAAELLAYGAFGESGVREFFAHVRFHKHEEERIVVHMLVELYARSAEEATEVLESAAHGQLEITSLAEESRPPAHASDEAH